MKTKFVLLIAVLGIAFSAFASNDTGSNNKPTITIVEDNTDVVFTMDMLTPTDNAVKVEYKWEPVPDGHGGVQIYEEKMFVPSFGSGGAGSWVSTGRCKSAEGTIYNCSTGGSVE